MRPKEKDLNFVLNGFAEGDPVPNWGDVMGGTSLITKRRTFTDANGTFEDAPFGVCSSDLLSATATQPLSVLVRNGSIYFPIRTNHFVYLGYLPGTGNIHNQGDINASYP